MNIQFLIIDRNPIFREKLGKFIKTFRDDFQVQTVANISEAIEAIVSTEFSLVLCEPSLADLKTGLVAHIIDKKPPLSLIITGQDGSHPLNGLDTLGCVKGFITRPVQLADLAGKVVLALDNLFYQGNVRGVNCTTLIQIFEQECRDYLVRVINSKEKIEGFLFFKKGILFDAICGATAALEAVKRVLSWESVDIELYNICPLNENRINVDMVSLILQSVKKKYTSEHPYSINGTEISPKSTYKSVGGLAGLLLKKAKKQ